MAAFIMACSCFLSPENERPTNVAPSVIAMLAGVDRRKIVDHAGLQLRSEIGGGGELAFGQAVHAVVFDDVDHRQIAAHEVDELADADGGGVAVAADAERDQIAIGQHGAGGHRRHAAMHRVEAVRAAHEISRALGRAADAAHLDDALGLDAHFVHGVDDALGDGIVSAAGAQRGFAALVVDDRQANAVVFGAGRGVVGVVAMLFALHGHDFVGYGACVERQAVNVGDAAQPRYQRRLDIQLEQAQHLRVAVLLDHIDAIVLLHEVVHFAGERIRLESADSRSRCCIPCATDRGFRESPSAKCRRR